MPTPAAAGLDPRRALGLLRRRAVLVGALAAPAWAAEPVAEALQRPALPVRRPEAAVLQAIAAAGDRWVAVGERGLIVLSDDAGRRWRQAPSPVSVTLTALRFADAQHGVAVGHGGTVLTTADGGARWTRRLEGRALATRVLEAAQASGDAARLRDAERLVADGPDKPLLDVLMPDARRIVVVGAYGLALRSDDAGASWQVWSHLLDNPKGLHLYALRQRGEQWLVAGEQGLVLRSDDGGRSFRRLASPYAGSWFTAEILPDGSLLLAGLRGHAWRSADGGASWSVLKAPAPVSFTASTLTSDGSVLLANQAGGVFTLQADRLRPLLPAALPPIHGLAALPGGRIVTVGITGVVPLAAAGPAQQLAQGTRP